MRGSGPFLRVCLGSSVISEFTPSPEHAPRTKVPTDRTFGPAAQQDGGTRPPFAARSVLGGTRHLPLWTYVPDTCPYRCPVWSFRRSLPFGRRCVRPSASRRWHSEGPDPARTDPPTNPAVYGIKSGDAPRRRTRRFPRRALPWGNSRGRAWQVLQFGFVIFTTSAQVRGSDFP